MSDNFQQRLSKAIHASGMAKREVAEAVGVQPPALSRWLSGTIPEARHLSSLAQTLNIPVNWLISGEGPLPESRQVEMVHSRVQEMPPEFIVMPNRVPLISWAHAGAATSYEELPQSWQESVPTTCKSPGAFALSIEGDSMQPYCHQGDIAIVMPHEEPRGGCLIVAKLRNDGVLLRRYTKTLEGIRLTAYNPVYPASDYNPEEFHWIYPVHSTVRREW